MFDHLLVNGDSYSASGAIPSYSIFLGQSLNLPVTNLARPGSSNDRILRSTLEEVINLKKQNKNPLVIIGWSFIRRLEVWYYGTNKDVFSRIPDIDITGPDYQQSRFITLDALIKLNEATLEQKCLVQDDLFIHKHLTDFYTNLYLFAHTLDSLNVKWFMFSAAKNVESKINCFPYIESLEHVKWCQQQSNIYKLHDFCILDWANENDPYCNSVTGHLSKSGHEKFTKELLNWLRSNKIV